MHGWGCKKEVAPLLEGSGAKYWQRPTFARPIDALSSGLRRFTSVFGMGTGGTTALISPEGCSRRDRHRRRGGGGRGKISHGQASDDGDAGRTRSDIYIQGREWDSPKN